MLTSEWKSMWVNAVDFSLFIRSRLHKHAWHFVGNQLIHTIVKTANEIHKRSALIFCFHVSVCALYSHRVRPIETRTHIFAKNYVLFLSFSVARMHCTSCLISTAERNEIYTHTSTIMWREKEQFDREAINTYESEKIILNIHSSEWE